jgi:hypothetical protein
MRRTAGFVLAALALSGVMLAFVYTASSSGPGSVYTVPQLRRLLARNGAAWAGRIVAVRGSGAALAWGNVVSLLLCGPSSGVCAFGTDHGTTSHLLLVPDSAGTGQSAASVFEGSGRLAYTAADGSSPASLTLRVSQPSEPAILDVLRRLPFVGSLMPVGDIKVYGRSAVYSIRLLATPATCSPPTQICDDAMLLGSQP